jgi:hypothetical protein
MLCREMKTEAPLCTMKRHHAKDGEGGAQFHRFAVACIYLRNGLPQHHFSTNAVFLRPNLHDFSTNAVFFGQFPEKYTALVELLFDRLALAGGAASFTESSQNLPRRATNGPHGSARRKRNGIRRASA